MKYVIVRMALVLSLLLATHSRACPTCIGRLTQASPAFFSPEYYSPGQSVPASNVDATVDEPETLPDTDSLLAEEES